MRICVYDNTTNSAAPWLDGRRKGPQCNRWSLAKVLHFTIAELIVVLLLTTVDARAGIDRDCDGLSDTLEQQLLDRHRPILHWEASEQYWPISADDFVRGSRLTYGRGPSAVEIYSHMQLAIDPTLALRASEVNPGFPSTVLASSCRSDYHLDLHDSLRVGTHPGDDGGNHLGMYGHVVRSENDEILIQYWQLLGFNEARQSGFYTACGVPSVADCGDALGDHEGEWLHIDVFVSNTAPHRVKRYVYYHHGSECPPTVIDNPITSIPECYLEGGAHEWWPFPSAGQGVCCFVALPDWVPICGGDCIEANPSHDGSGITYRVPVVPNIGEPARPMPGNLSANLILSFNGRWGGDGVDCSIWIPIVVPFVYGISSEPASSPMHQGYRRPLGQEVWPLLQQIYDLGTSGNQKAINNAGQILGNAAGRPKLTQVCFEPFDTTTPSVKGFSAPQNVCDAQGRCLAENGHVGGTFYCYLGMQIPVVWSSPSEWLQVRHLDPPQNIAHGLSMISLHATNDGMRGIATGRRRYANGFVFPLEYTGLPSGYSFPAAGVSNVNNDLVAQLQSGGWSIAGTVNASGTMSVLGAPGYHSAAADINDLGVAVGSRFNHAVIWSNGIGIEPWPGEGGAACINNVGIVGGTRTGFGGVVHSDGITHQVIDLIEPAAGAFNGVSVVYDINDRGLSLVMLDYDASSSPAHWTIIDLRSRARIAPTQVVATIGSAITLTATTHGLPASNFHWYRNETQLLESDSTLKIVAASLTDAGCYRYIGGNVLGVTMSDVACVAVVVPGDATGDDEVNIDDLLAVVVGWGQCPAEPAVCLGDVAPEPPLSGDGIVDIDDLLMVINHWE